MDSSGATGTERIEGRIPVPGGPCATPRSKGDRGPGSIGHRRGGSLPMAGGLPVRPLLIFQLTLIFVPASMTTDIFNYALYGEMPVLYGVNPFIHTPSEFPQNPLYYLIPLYWHDAPSVYGPLWVAISVGVASVFRT